MTTAIYRLGIDVGGTNTDGVLLDESLNVISKVKVATTHDISTGIDNAIDELLRQANLTGESVKHAMLGTTQCTNAIVEKRGLDKVGMLRLALPSGSAVPPLCGWSASWQTLLGEHFYQPTVAMNTTVKKSPTWMSKRSVSYVRK
ncbi:N-methylhydantoinase [Vibrio variabilis]|uniref:N-methylhydantoinase n=1 Tax=Vibrio variabilis TaxID=990271 RepID=A0ABQ0J8W9_9VIBR|nr:N-methylhydantoinase [Vibrio variabilis]